MTQADLSTLCRACGFCCRGTLFDHVAVHEAEAAPLAARRLRLRVAQERWVSPQPCAAHEASGCGVYEHRPAACAAFFCLLATALREGEVDLAEALEIVEEGRRWVARAEAELDDGDAASVSLWQRLRVALEQGRVSLATVQDYERFMKRNFLGRHG